VVLAVAVVSAVALTGCPNDSEDEAVSDEFCAAYLDAVDLGLGSAEGIAAFRRVAELAPEDARAGAAMMVALAERAEAVSAGSEGGDLTGDAAYMELVLESRSDEVRRSTERLTAIGREECGAAGPEDQTPVTPFTSIAPDG
jgi:hypothetical protein